MTESIVFYFFPVLLLVSILLALFVTFADAIIHYLDHKRLIDRMHNKLDFDLDRISKARRILQRHTAKSREREYEDSDDTES